jgi:hypothetical protein
MQNNFSLSIGSYHYTTNYAYYLGETPVNISAATINSFQVSPTFSIDADFSATLPGGAFNISRQKGYSSFDCGLTKTADHNKLVFTLSAADLLHSDVQGASTKTATLSTVNTNYYDFRQLMLSVRYKFGKELKTVKKKSNPPELNRLR